MVSPYSKKMFVDVASLMSKEVSKTAVFCVIPKASFVVGTPGLEAGTAVVVNVLSDPYCGVALLVEVATARK